MLADVLLEHIEMRSRVLEIGCREGALSRVMARRGAKVTAIDANERMIDAARQKTPATLGIELYVGNLLALSPRGFDVAIAVDALGDLPLAAALERMAGAVRSGGFVLVSDRYTSRAIKSILRDVLPGVRIRRHLGGRYTAIWRKP